MTQVHRGPWDVQTSRNEALRACPACGHGISKYAKACPECGNPNESPPERAGRIAGGIVVWFWLIVVLGLIFL